MRARGRERVLPVGAAPAGGGRRLRAEALAIEKFRPGKFVLSVVSQRSELAEFYVRRGYRKTDVAGCYPSAAGIGAPMRADLKVDLYEKAATGGLVSGG